MGRRGVLVFVSALVTALLWTVAPVRAQGAAAHEDEFARSADRARARVGLAAYAIAPDLVDVARRHAARMAAEGRLHHNPSLGSEVQGWQAVGENVGVGDSVESIHRAFMDSPTHRDNIVSPTFTQVGMGVHVDDDGAIWVAQVFRTPEAAPEPQPEPAPAPTEERQASPSSGSTGTPAPTPAGPPAAAAPPAAEPPSSGAAGATGADGDAADAAAVAAASEVAGAAASAVGAAQAPVPAPVRPSSTGGDATPMDAASAGAGDAGGRDVTLPIGVAAFLLLAVVAGVFAEVVGYPLSAWRRQRNQASMSSSRSPSSTAWTLPVS